MLSKVGIIPRVKVAVSIPTIRVALLVLGALIPFIFAHTSSAQTTSRSRFGATLSGSISPAANGVGASVSLTGPTTASATADSNGRFSFRGLASGAYTDHADQDGVHIQSQQSYSLIQWLFGFRTFLFSIA